MGEHRRALGWVALGLGVATAAAGVGARRWVDRDRARPDPYAGEAYGAVRGKPIGPVASFDRTALNVEEIGAGTPTIIFAHGFSLNLTIWHHQITGLADDARLILYDQRGHGRSAPSTDGDYSLDALARDLDAVVTAAGVEPVVLVGHSMGGMAVLRYCELFPATIGDRVAGVILVGTTAADVLTAPLPVGSGRRTRATLQGLQEALFRALAGRSDTIDHVRFHGSRLSYLGTRMMGFGRTPSPAQVDFVERILGEVRSDVWMRLLPAMFAMDVQESLPSIDVPSLVVVGERDRLTPPGAAQRIAEALPNASLVVLPDAGHTAMLEAPDRFNDAVRGFLAGLEGQRAG